MIIALLNISETLPGLYLEIGSPDEANILTTRINYQDNPMCKVRSEV